MPTTANPCLKAIEALTRALRWLMVVALCAGLVDVSQAQLSNQGSEPVAAQPVPAYSAALTIAPPDSDRVSLSLDKDLITFSKWAIIIGGSFVGALALIGAGFFGLDVRQARKSMQEAREETARRMEEIRLAHQSLKDLKDNLEKLGAQLIEEVDRKKSPGTFAVPDMGQAAPPGPAGSAQMGALEQLERENESIRATLRLMLHMSEFEWSTLGTLAKKIGLPEARVMALADSDPLIQRGTGRQGAVLYRLKIYNHTYDHGHKTMSPEEITKLLWEHAAKGKFSTKSLS